MMALHCPRRGQRRFDDAGTGSSAAPGKNLSVEARAWTCVAPQSTNDLYPDRNAGADACAVPHRLDRLPAQAFFALEVPRRHLLVLPGSPRLARTAMLPRLRVVVRPREPGTDPLPCGYGPRDPALSAPTAGSRHDRTWHLLGEVSWFG